MNGSRAKPRASLRGAAPDRGGASLLVAAVGLFLVCAGVAGAAVIGAEAAARRVRIAADLGALAGAPLAPRGESVACERAARVITANGARTASCDADGLTLTVRAEIDVEPWPGLRTVIGAEARAGPATAPAGPGELVVAGSAGHRHALVMACGSDRRVDLDPRGGLHQRWRLSPKSAVSLMREASTHVGSPPRRAGWLSRR